MNYIPETEHPNNVVLRELHDDQVYIYKPDGSLLGVTDDERTFNDFRIQVKQKQLSGYTISLDGGETKIPVNEHGHLHRWPYGLFSMIEQQLDCLI